MQHKQENKLHATGPPSWADDTIRQSLRLHGMIQTGLALLKPTVMYGEWVSHANRTRTCLFFFFLMEDIQCDVADSHDSAGEAPN